MNKPRKSYAQIYGNWIGLAAGLEANEADLPHLDSPRQELTDLMAEAQNLLAQQAAQAAAKQETTKRLQELIDRGLKLATFLRVGVKQHYGTRSEKLVEFHLQPFRGRRSAQPEDSRPDSE
ncbi:MAG TPA: hypothetical protein VH394_20200 [Thermoanaerobaculia bacterium]|nr:hypothetical protein [Thermoanaerobaculia bacterium]